jgi:hypothetical protein
MQVSKNIFWILALLAALSFAFAPITAGDHPWNEDESGSGAGDNGEPDNGDVSPDDPGVILPDNLDELFGSSLFWWDIVTGPLTSETIATETVTESAPSAGNPNQAGGQAR